MELCRKLTEPLLFDTTSLPFKLSISSSLIQIQCHPIVAQALYNHTHKFSWQGKYADGHGILEEMRGRTSIPKHCGMPIIAMLESD